MNTSPPPRPSAPSQRLIALTTPITANTVSGTANRPSSRGLVAHQIAERMQHQPAPVDHQQRGRDLRREFDRGLQVEQVVERAGERDQEQAGPERRVHLARELRQQRRQRQADHDRQPAHGGRVAGVVLAPRRRDDRSGHSARPWGRGSGSGPASGRSPAARRARAVGFTPNPASSRRCGSPCPRAGAGCFPCAGRSAAPQSPARPAAAGSPCRTARRCRTARTRRR